MENNKPYRRGKIRFLALFLASMLMFGNQYAFNNPQALQESFEQILDISEPQFNLLYTIFAFPNIFTTLIIGVLIDFLGVRIGVISLSLGVALAQIIVAFGGAYQSYTTLLIGRMVFGIASQSLITAQASITSFWFKGKQLATALGIILTFPQVGNALNSYLTPEVFEATNSLGPPLFLSVGFCFISFICGIILVLLDMRADKIDRQNPHLLNKYGETQQSGEHVKCSDIKQLPGTFWIVLILCMFAMSLYVPFMDNANRLYQKRFCFSQVGAGKALMLTYLICPIVSPFLGMAVDKFGKRRFFMVLTSITYLFAQFLILVYPSCLDTIEVGSITGLIFIGIGYALYSNCLVPVIPIIVKHSITGTAFGLMAMIQSIALSTFPLISSNLVNAQEDPQIGFRYSSIFFTTMAALGLITSLSLYMIDKKLGKKLDAIDYQQIPFTEEFTESDKTGNISQILTPIKNTSSVDLQQSLLNKNVQQNFKQISKEQKAKYDFDL